MRLLGRVVSSIGCVLIMDTLHASSEVAPGDVLRFSYADIRVAHGWDIPFRNGSVRVTGTSPQAGTYIRVDNDPKRDVIAFCDGDFAYVDEIAPDKANEDHAALVTYLLSAVRRNDWHAVSDAANDLRVLEARRGRP